MFVMNDAFLDGRVATRSPFAAPWRNICVLHHPHKADAALLAESGLSEEDAGQQIFYEGAGCLECGGTGYRGRTAIHELLDLSDWIREMILERRPASEIKRAALEDGMTSLRDCALQKAFSGETSLREINKVTFIEG